MHIKTTKKEIEAGLRSTEKNLWHRFGVRVEIQKIFSRQGTHKKNLCDVTVNELNRFGPASQALFYGLLHLPFWSSKFDLHALHVTSSVLNVHVLHFGPPTDNGQRHCLPCSSCLALQVKATRH